MTTLWKRLAPTIWAQLFLMVLAVVLVTWAVVGVAFYWFGTAQKFVQEMSAEQVPLLLNATELSSHAADVAMLSNRILTSPSPNVAVQEAALQRTITSFDALLRQDETNGLSAKTTHALQSNLSAIIQVLEETRRIDANLLEEVDKMRWLNVDFQDEIAAFKADTAYNIETIIFDMQTEPDQLQRQLLAQDLRDEQERATMFADLGDAMSVATTLAIQSAASETPRQLEQFEVLLGEARSRANRWLDQSRATSETVSLEQGLVALDQNALSATGLVETRRHWFATRDRLRRLLESSFVILNKVQAQTRNQTNRQRAELDAVSSGFAESSRKAVRMLALLTIIAAVAGGGILVFYIRPSIIRPVQRLTRQMQQIAEGQQVMLARTQTGNDEISDLARAVEAFQTSVTEREQAIESLRQTQSELVQAGKIAALGSLSAGISHELNQPLGAIRQRLRLTEKALTDQDVPGAERQVGKIENLVERIERIIDHLRRFARRSEYRREPVALLPLVDETAELLSSKLSGCNATLKVAEGVDQIVFLGDSVLTAQVLVNLISNAADAIAETGNPGTITIAPDTAPEGMVAFSVVDTGTGFGDLPPDQAVNPFVTTKGPGDGMGLGLSISLNILTGMGGGLALAQRADEPGARATVRLPEGKI